MRILAFSIHQKGILAWALQENENVLMAEYGELPLNHEFQPYNLDTLCDLFNIHFLVFNDCMYKPSYLGSREGYFLGFYWDEDPLVRARHFALMGYTKWQR